MIFIELSSVNMIVIDMRMVPFNNDSEMNFYPRQIFFQLNSHKLFI